MSEIAALVADNLDIWTGAIERKSSAGRGGGKRMSLHGIVRLRALILGLAVRGKLVEQDRADEPASKLLSKIRAAKPEYLLDNGLPKSQVLAGAIDQSPFDLPANWAWARLGDIAAYIQRGKSPKYSEGSGIFVISQRCVQWTGLDLGVAKEISQSSLLTYEPYRFLRSDDLLWNSTGTGTIGRVIALSGVPDGLVCDSHVTLVRCPWVYARYLQSWLASDDVYGKIEVLAAGSTNQIEWTAKLAASQLVPLPPLAEQHRIVAKVDELMALCDALERGSADALAAHQTLVEALLATLVNSADASDLAANWARLESHFDTLFTTEASVDALKQTILDLAVRGKLTGTQPTRNDQISQMFELLDGDRGSKYPKNSDYFAEGYCLFLSTKNVRKNGFLFDELQYISEHKHQELRQGTLKRGDLIITTRGTLGNIAYYDETIPYNVVRINSGMLIMRPKCQTLDQKFVMLFIQSPEFDKQMQSKRSGSAQPQIPAGILKTFFVPIFEVAEQHRIVAKVEELMALCDGLKSRINDADETQRHLADAITQRAAA